MVGLRTVANVRSSTRALASRLVSLIASTSGATPGYGFSAEQAYTFGDALMAGPCKYGSKTLSRLDGELL